jgi:hypothetical protein
MYKSRIFAVLGVALLFAAAMNAQVAGRVSGAVVDGTGAAVPDATVSLKLPASDAAAYTTKTTAAGDFNLLSVNPFTYDLVVEASGFQTAKVAGVKVDPGRTLDIAQIKMEIAGVTQTVEVTSATQTVQTSNAEVATTITNSQIVNLPVLNRSPLGFVLTQAGVNSGAGNTTINGQRVSFTNITIDGINIQDNFIRTNAVDFLPNLLLLDQVAEVTLSTSNANASSFGGSSQIAFVTPSGTNEFHGGLYASNRNSHFAANSFNNNKSGVKNPFLNQNQLGGKLGGHIIKNKLFIYGNYEAYRQHAQTTINTTVPTADARSGIYTYRDTGGNIQKVNVLNAYGTKADPATQAILAKIPTADKINNYDVGDSTAAFVRNTAGYRYNARNNRIRDNVTIKGDYILSPTNSFTLSYLLNRDKLDRNDSATTYDVVPTVANDGKTKLMSFAWRTNPTSSLTNEARFGFNWAPAIFLATAAVPAYYITGLPYTNPINTFRTQGRNTDTYNYSDNANWVHGKHSLAFGFQGQATRIEQYNDASITPSYGLGLGSSLTGLSATQLPGISSTDLTAANTMLAFQGGYYNSYTQIFNVTSTTSGFVKGANNTRHNIYDNYAFYLQDTWKLARRLTLNLGARWDYYTVVDERDGLALFPVIQNNNVIQTALSNTTVLDFAGGKSGRPWYHADKNNIAPNLGLAYDLHGDGKTAIRAGYSLSYVNDNMVRSADNSQSTNSGLQSTSSGSLTSGQFATGLFSVPVPTFKVPRTVADNYATNTSAAVAMPDPGLVTPYVQQWNIGVQQTVKGGGILDIRYVGNHATKQVRGIDFNQVLINQLLPDFITARNNGLLAQGPNLTGAFNPAYNPAIAGSQPLPFISQLGNGGNLTNATVRSNIQTGAVGELASYYQVNALNGPFNFYRNNKVLGANVLMNYSNTSYNGLQVDYQKRFAKGLAFQVNYVFSRLLGDANGDQQTDFEPFLDINNTKIERHRPVGFDITHVLKGNFTYDLPLGPGKRFKSSNRVLSKIMEGWNVAGIFTKQSGSPFGVVSTRGTLNRAARSGQNTVNTFLNKDQLDELFQLRMTGTGPVFVPASIKGTDGRAVQSDGAAPFTGQVFYQPQPGTIGTLQRAYFSSPWVWDLDLKASKTTHVTEKNTIELRIDSTNAMNHSTWYISGDLNVTSTTFGNLTSRFYGNRLVQFALYYRF